MSKKSFWLLGFLMIALAFGGFGSARAQLSDVEIVDVDDDGNGNNTGAPGSELRVEGDADDRDNVGTPAVLAQEVGTPPAGAVGGTTIVGPSTAGSVSRTVLNAGGALDALSLATINLATPGLAPAPTSVLTATADITVLTTSVAGTTLGRWLVIDDGAGGGEDYIIAEAAGFATVNIYRPVWVPIYEGSMTDAPGNHELNGTEGTNILSGTGALDPNNMATAPYLYPATTRGAASAMDEVRADFNGDVSFSFRFPYNVFAGAPTPYVSAIRFINDSDGADMSAIRFAVQVPGGADPWFVEVDSDGDDILTNGSLVELDIDLEDLFGNEIENVRLLLDFSNLDSAFHGSSAIVNDAGVALGAAVGADTYAGAGGVDIWDGAYDLTTGAAGYTMATADMFDLVTDNDARIADGSLIVEDRGNGRYAISYRISDDNVTTPGIKMVTVRAVAFPGFPLPATSIGSVYTAFGYTPATGAPRPIIMAKWMTMAAGSISSPAGDTQVAHYVLDNMAPNFDFAILDPYATPLGADHPNAIVAGERVYYLTEGQVCFFVQIDPDDLNAQELNEVDEPDASPMDLNDMDRTGTENLYLRNIKVIGDISELLDPAYLAANPADTNGNGIPDVAEVIATYAGRDGIDNDRDGEDSNREDDEDDTTNGINERFLFRVCFTVDWRFKGIATRPATTGPLSIRFLIEDTLGNRSRFSAWRETYNEDTDAWTTDTAFPAAGGWLSQLGRSQTFVDATPAIPGGRIAGLPGDQSNPILFDEDLGILFAPEGAASDGLDNDGDWNVLTDDTVVADGMPTANEPNFDATDPEEALIAANYSEAYAPNANMFPMWVSGYQIMLNWSMPWQVIIDTACVNSSIVTSLEMGVTTTDSRVINGAAVIPAGAPGATATTPATAVVPAPAAVPSGIDVRDTGNVIHEITGGPADTTGDGLYDVVNLVRLTAKFQGSDDAFIGVVEYSSDGTTYMPVKGNFLGDVVVPGLGGLPSFPDMVGNYTDLTAPGADEDANYHDGINGDDDNDNDSDTSDRDVRDAMLSSQNDGVDNDGDGLVDAGDRNVNNIDTDAYDPLRDEDEDGIMDEDEAAIYVTIEPVSTNQIVQWTFDPVRIARILQLLPNKAYAFRVVIYDRAGNVCDIKAAPIYIVFRVVGEGLQQLAGTAEASLYEDDQVINTLINKNIPENHLYEVRATTTGNVENVTFDRSPDEVNWTPFLHANNPDPNTPFRITWRPELVTTAAGGIDENGDGAAETGTTGTPEYVAGSGYAAGQDLFIRARPGKFGNLGWYDVVDGLTIDEEHFSPYDVAITVPAPPSEAAFDLVVAIVDSKAPVLSITQLGTDMMPADGALIPIDTGVILKARTTAASDADISDAYWELAVSYPDGTRAVWSKIICTTDLYPLAVTGGFEIVSQWDTTNVAAGTYDIRPIAVDNGGLVDPMLAPIAHIVIGYGKKTAFIETPTHGATISGNSTTVTARIYFDWDTLLDTVPAGGDNVFSAAEENAMANDIERVIFQYREIGGTWILITSVPSTSANIVVNATYADWTGTWSLFDLEGTYEIRAVTVDDKGYWPSGMSSIVTVGGIVDLRTGVTNFFSDEDENDRISMHLARNGVNEDIIIIDRDSCTTQGMRVILRAEQWPLTIEPDNVVFEYKINPIGAPVDPKMDSGWTPVNLPTLTYAVGGAGTVSVTALANSTDVPADGFVMEWNIPAVWDHDMNNTTAMVVNPLHNLTTATLIYIRARAIKGPATAPTDSDAYTDETDFVPFVALVFEETIEPTASIAKLLRADDAGNVDLEAYKATLTLSGTPADLEYRLTPGASGDRQELLVIPAAYDNHPLGNPQQQSPLAKAGLWYKLCRLASRDGDTLLWQLADTSTDSPYVVNWDWSNVPTGKYNLLLVFTDKAGNRSANPWCDTASAGSKIVTIDREGPTPYVENPDSLSNDGALSCNNTVLLSVSSYQGCVDEIILEYGREGFSEDIPVLSEEETYTFEYQDLNSNGQWDPGEPWRISGLPTDTQGGDFVDPIDGEIAWTEISKISFSVPAFAAGNVRGINATENTFISGVDSMPYWYHDNNGNGRYDAGEPVWKDMAAGNWKRYNYHDRTVKEDIIVGGLRPVDEAPGSAFGDIPDVVKDYNCSPGAIKWADVPQDHDNNPLTAIAANNEFDEGDFIWIDLDGDNAYDGTQDGVCEPIVYASNSIIWSTIDNLPPTNNTRFDLRVRASDKEDSAGKPGTWGLYIGPVRVENISAVLRMVNGRKLYESEYVNEFLRISGNTVDVTVRVGPEPEGAAVVGMWYRYDNSLYPGGVDADNNGFPDDGTVGNSRWDGLDNDADTALDEEQMDKDSNDKKWGEVNVWQPFTILSSAVTARNTEDGAFPDKNWFDVTLTLDVSGFEGEFQYEIAPIVVDGSGFGVNFTYATLPWATSPARFPQTGACAAAYTFERIIIDHQGPYTYTQITLDEAVLYEGTGYLRGLASWSPLNACDPEDMILRTNDYAERALNDKRIGSDDYRDDPGEDNYTTFDLQAKVVSIYGGLDYTKSYGDSSGGVEFQYRVVGGEWQHLGYDREPDFTGSYMLTDNAPAGPSLNDVMVATTVDHGYPNGSEPDPIGYWPGDMIPYSGWIVDSNPDNNATEVPVPMGATTQRISIATFSYDNIDISNLANFPSTGIGSEEYQFRTVANDLSDVYGGVSTRTGDTPTSTFDVYVLKNRVGAAQRNASENQNFMRDIDWQLGVPFDMVAPNPVIAKGAIFINPHVDVGVEEYVMGPRNDGKDETYTVNNVLPKAEIVQVDVTKYPWTAESGVDPVALEGDVDATVHIGDDILFEAIANPDPNGVGVWGTTPDVAGDIVDGNGHAEVRLYARENDDDSDHKDDSDAAPSNDWVEVGMGAAGAYIDNEAGLGDFPNAANNRYTFRVNIDATMLLLGLTDGSCELEFMAVAIDKECNAEPFLGLTGELVVRVLDFVGPDILVGGLALDADHLTDIIERLGSSPGGYGGIVNDLMGQFAGSPFTDTAGLDLNNFGNGVFPANPRLIATTNRIPLAKVSGELLQLYVINCCPECESADTVTFEIYDKSNTLVYSDIVTRGDSDGFAEDTWLVAAERAPGNEVVPGLVPHTFSLSEQTALLYLPTWTDVDGNNVPRFENVWVRYLAQPNGGKEGDDGGSGRSGDATIGGCVAGTGSLLDPPNPYIDDKVAMTRHVNRKGENIWTADLNLELGKTYFYYFLVDTVGHNWTVPDPRNLMMDEFLKPAFMDSLALWLTSGSIGSVDSLFHNIPVISKLWVPGTQAGKDAGQIADDEIFYTTIDLDVLPDGVYEVRVKGTDQAGFTDMVSKTIVLDRTPPPIDPNADINVPGRVKANTIVPITAILRDPPSGVNVVDTVGVLFEISRRGNTEDAVSTWQYAADGIPFELPDLGSYSVPDDYQTYTPRWLWDVAIDIWPNDGLTSGWLTPNTDQNIAWYVRAVPFDDAMNVQVKQTNQVLVIVDGSVPKLKVLKASVVRAGTVIDDDADEFDLYPDDGDVTLTAELVENIDGDLDGDGVIESDAGESINIGMKSVTFQYSLKIPDATDASGIKWNDIPASQYSTPQLIPTADGKWQVTWQVDFSQLINEEYDQYIHVRAVGEDEVGNRDEEAFMTPGDPSSGQDPLRDGAIHGIMVFHDITGPIAEIRHVDGRNVLDPHLAVSYRTDGSGDNAEVDVQIDAYNVAVVLLEYRKAGDTSWIEVAKKVGSDVTASTVIPWRVASLVEDKYELRVSAFDGDGNMTASDVVWVIVDHTEPEVVSIKMFTDEDHDDTDVIYAEIYPGGDSIYRYSDGTDYFKVKVIVTADGTNPINGQTTEASSVSLQYFDVPNVAWMDVPNSAFTYTANDGVWTLVFTQKDLSNELAALFRPINANGVLPEGEVQFRALVTDYAGNRNTLDRNSVFVIIADASDPTIIAVYSGGRDWEGGAECTIVGYGGDVVDLWAKVKDTGTGAARAEFFIPGSPAAGASTAATEWQSIGIGVLEESIGGIEPGTGENLAHQLWHLEWTTPMNQDGNNFKYLIAVEVTDEAGNKSDSKYGLSGNQTTDALLTSSDDVDCVLVNIDRTAPAPPEVLYVVTHAGRVTDRASDLPAILDEFNACDYDLRKMLPVGADTNKDTARADKYEVFDLYNNWNVDTKVAYINPDQYDTSLEIWVRTSELEYGAQPGKVGYRQYENYDVANPAIKGQLAGGANYCDQGPESINVPYGSLEHDPGIEKIYIHIAYDLNQDGDPSDIVDWVKMDNHDTEGKDEDSGFMDPRATDGDDNAFLTSADVKRIPVYDYTDDKVHKGYSYYWVMGDDFGSNESVWNTEASVANDGEVLDPKLAKDGIHFIRMQAKDKSGNLSDYGYTMVRVHNQDDIPPARTAITLINGEDEVVKWPPMEWKWHKVTVRTYRNQVGPWWFGGGPHCTQDHDLATGRRSKFFTDIDHVVVEMFDNECNEWVNVSIGRRGTDNATIDVGKSFSDGLVGDYCNGDRGLYWTEWEVLVDSTLVGDGNTEIRAYAVDNAGKFNAPFPDGDATIHTQRDRRNVEADKGDVNKKPVMVDNPRAQVVMPVTGAIVERGELVQVQGVPVQPGGDPIGNGHDVGQVAFMVKRKAVVPGGIEGPWILIDAKDSNLNGEFGEPLASEPMDPSDTNQPYMVWWRVPDWLVIDDPETEHIRETEASYYVVAVAGDSMTGPMMEASGQESLWEGTSPPLAWANEVPGDNVIHWDNPHHIIRNDNCTLRAQVVIVTDTTPPRTRVLQFGDYDIASETKIVVGQTVTVAAGDTEVDWAPPGTFPTPPFEVFDGDKIHTFDPNDPLPVTDDTAWSANESIWYTDDAKNTAWSIGMLYPSISLLQPMYDDEDPSAPAYEQYLTHEWRANGRVEFRYAGPLADDAPMPVFPASGETWDDTAWAVAESDAIHMAPFDGSSVGRPKWQFTNWVTGGTVVPDGKYYGVVIGTDDIGHQTGIPVGNAPRVLPDVVTFYVDNNAPAATLLASELKPDGTLDVITNGEFERGRPVVLAIDETFSVADLDAVTFYFKLQHDYRWTAVVDTAQSNNSRFTTQPYLVTLSPLGGWDGISENDSNIALGNVYQFKAVVEDGIGNENDSNIVELLIVDRTAEADIARIDRIDGANADEMFLLPNMINDMIAAPRLTGRVRLWGFADADTVGTTFLFRPQGADTWIEIEAMHKTSFGQDGTIDGDFGTSTAWDRANWMTDGLDNDGDGEADEPGESGYHYEGQQYWEVVWDTTTLNGLYEIAVVANTGADKSMNGFSIMTVYLDHNAYDITDSIEDYTPGDGSWVGGRTRRPIEAQNPRLDPDDKLPDSPRGEVDVCVVFADGIPADLDMGIPTGVTLTAGGVTTPNADGSYPDTALDLTDTAITHLNPSVSFEWKYSVYPDIGDETVNDKTLGSVPAGHKYWQMIASPVIYDANSGRFCTVWQTVANGVLNGYFDLRVRVVDEAGNIAYKVFAQRVVVDNTSSAAMITSINDDTTLTYVGTGGLATDTELDRDTDVEVRATVIDALTDVGLVQFQVRAVTLEVGPPFTDPADEIPVGFFTGWTDVGLGVVEDDPEDSYMLHWNTSGMPEGEYLLRVKVTDVVGNKMVSSGVRVTIVDTTPPIACIAGYYPKQMQVFNWPKKYWRDTIYAVTICQADIQEVQIQYRAVGDIGWITIGVPQWIPFEQLDSPLEKALKIGDLLLRKRLFPPSSTTLDEVVNEAFDWTGLWGASWDPSMLAPGAYEVRAIAKDWAGNVTPEDMAPILTIEVENGVVNPETPGNDINIEFTANLGGIGVGGLFGDYKDEPGLVVTVEAPEKPTVLVLVELDSPEGIVFGGEIVDVKAENGVSGRYSAAIKGDDLLEGLADFILGIDNYLDLIRLGGRVTVYATTPSCPGIGMATLAMDDLRVYPVTAELGTNGTVYSKDGAVSVMIPRAALLEPVPDGNSVIPPIGPFADGAYFIERAGLMITPTGVMPNTPRDQRLHLEPRGQAYSIDFFNSEAKYEGFRPGFEPVITMRYDDSIMPHEEPFISVRYWDPLPDVPLHPEEEWGGMWANVDIINMSVNPENRTVTFNVTGFGDHDRVPGESAGDSTDVDVPHAIYTIVVEKSLGRIENVVFDSDDDDVFVYNANPDVTYIDGPLSDYDVYFTIIDPGGIDNESIRIYVDGVLVSINDQFLGGREWGHVDFERWTELGNATYRFMSDDVVNLTDYLAEGWHTLKIEAWDHSDAVNESDWRMLEKTVQFYIDTTPPVVVTHAAQRDGVRWFSSIKGATAAITIVDEGVGVDGQDLQNDMFVDVFQHLTANQTPLRTKDSGDIINFQRKTLIATTKPILEYTDEYTPDGIDNETWTSIQDGASATRHLAWRASYTIQVGQISDGDTFEVVFYGDDKIRANMRDYNNENAVYLFEDMTNAYLMVWDGGTADDLSIAGTGVGVGVGTAGDMDVRGDGIDRDADIEVGTGTGDGRIVVVPATQVPALFEAELLNTWAQDVWWNYYTDHHTFLQDGLGNEDDDADYFVRNLVADTRAPVVTLNVPEGITANTLAATISANATDDASGIEGVSLLINGEVIAEKAGPVINISLSHTLAQGEATNGSEIVIMAIDQAGNETVVRQVLGVQETDGPVISAVTPEGEGIADATPTIAAAYSDDSGIDVDSVVLTLNGAVITTATVGVASVSYTPVEPLEAGITYTVKLTVADEAGAVSESIWTFALETDAPEITDTAPSGVDETGRAPISAKFADAGVGVDVGTARLVVDGDAVDAAVTASSVSFRPADVLASGTHSATLSVADVAGNVAELTWEFNVEDTAPSVTNVEPAGTINDDMPVLSGSYSDSGTGIDVDTVQLSLNGEIVQAEVTPNKVSFGVQEPLRPGVSYTVSVTVADKAGNVGSSSSTFQLENRGPTISSNSPTGTVQSVDVAISANYSDSGSGVDQSTALMKVDGVAVAATASASGISYQGTGLLAGDHAIYVEVSDRFGNASSRSWSFKVEENAPTISVVEPDGEVNEATPTISASYDDAGTGIDVSSVVLKLGGQILPAIATETSVSYKVLTSLERGVTYKVEVEVADKAGNVASSGSTFSLETDPPEVTSTKPSGTVSEDDAAAGILISAKLTDDGSGVDPDSAVMWLDGAVVAADASDASVQYTARGLGYGDHTVRLIVADMLGNSTDESWSFEIDDSTPPTVTVVSPRQDSVVSIRPVIKISYADDGSGVDLTSISVKVDDQAVVATAMAPAKPSGAKVVSAGEASYEVKLGFGSHTLTVVVKDVAGNEATAEVTFIVEGDILLLVKAHNYPNPFRGGDTKITFGLSQEADITIRIYDFTATLVATVVEDERTQADGQVEFSWDGTTDAGDGHQLANGIYYCQIFAKTDSERKSEIVKIALIRSE